MKKNKLTKDEKISIFTICLIVISYGAERIIELFVPQGKTLGIVMAMVCTVFLALTIYLLAKTKDPFSGLLTSLVAYKMMPVSISFLSDVSKGAGTLYFSLSKVANLIFLYFIYRFYRDQKKEKKVNAFTLIAIVACVPLSFEISNRLTGYFLATTGSMMGGYISQYALYIAATLIIFIAAFNSGYESLRLATSYEFIALGVNILKTAAKIGYRALESTHISRSYFVWIAVYLALIFCFTVPLKLRSRSNKNKQKSPV